MQWDQFEDRAFTGRADSGATNPRKPIRFSDTQVGRGHGSPSYTPGGRPKDHLPGLQPNYITFGETILDVAANPIGYAQYIASRPWDRKKA